MLAKLGIRHSEPVKGARFELTILAPWASEPPAAQIDGEELAAADKYRIEVLPRILNLIVPLQATTLP